MALVLGLGAGGAGAAGAAVIGAPPYVTQDHPNLYRLVLLAGAERLVPFSRSPNFKLVREAAQQLAARGAQAAQRGDETAALTDWLAVLRLSCALGRGSAHARPVLIDGMVGRAVEHMAVELLLRRARSGHLSPGAATRVLAALERRQRESMPSLNTLMANDGLAAQELMAQFEVAVSRGDVEALGRDTGFEEGKRDLLGLAHVRARDRAGVVRELASRTRRLFELLGADVEAGRAPTAPPAVSGGHGRIGHQRMERMWTTLCELLLPNVTKARMRIEQCEREVDELRAACTRVLAQ